jgi:adenine phosphoribosyltransferase
LEYTEKMIKEEIIRNSLPVYKDWPKPGINYLNTVDLCTNPIAFRESVEYFYNVAAVHDVDHLFAADARGFIWGSPVAYRLGIPLHVVRKKGKMPGELISREYELEYGTDTLELRKFNYSAGTILIVDDVLATGGTAEAICKLVHELGVHYNSMTVACLLNISFLPGKQKLLDLGVKVETLIDVNE